MEASERVLFELQIVISGDRVPRDLKKPYMASLLLPKDLVIHLSLHSFFS